MKRIYPAVAAAAVAVVGIGVAVGTTASGGSSGHRPTTTAAGATSHLRDLSVVHPTTTPIKHVVVLFDENISFDHYFGTYPNATNPRGEPAFQARPGTPSVNGLTGDLLNDNPNTMNPTRLDRSQAVTCDQNHAYKPEQQAADHGLMDKFIEYTGSGDCTSTSTGEYYRKGLVMDYYDGNTVTGLWNYAQHYAMSDNSYGTNFGPSTPGALNLIAGQTHGATVTGSGAAVANGTLFGDNDPTGDQCGKGTTVAMGGKNVGDLLNRRNITWGWFQGGFEPTKRTNGTAVCGASHANITGGSSADYSPHHEPFQYYKSTANPRHLRPSSVSKIGKTDRANHQYDLADFWAAADTGRLPEVSYLKAAEYQDGHAGYSDPIDEQHWLVNTINRIQTLPQWRNTAVVVAYDDSDGWYDHQMGPIVNKSSDPAQDALAGTGLCGKAGDGAYQDRCGYGPRLPLMVISPYAKANYVDHAITDQTSVLKFIEDNWRLGQIGDQSMDAKAGPLDGLFNFRGRPNTRPLLLNPRSGQPVGTQH